MRLTIEELVDYTGIPVRSIRETVRASNDAWRRYKTHGIPVNTAEKWAERLGMHPAEIWTNWPQAVLAAWS
jgi:hypothetical protein